MTFALIISFFPPDLLNSTACQSNYLQIIPIKPELKLTFSQKSCDTMTPW